MATALSSLDPKTYHYHHDIKPFDHNGHTINRRSRRAVENQLDIFDTAVEFFATAMRGRDTHPGQGTRKVTPSLSDRALDLLRPNADKPWIQQFSVDEAILIAFNAISDELMQINPQLVYAFYKLLVYAFYKLLDYTHTAGTAGISTAIEEGKTTSRSTYPNDFTAPDSTSENSMHICGGIPEALALREQVSKIMAAMRQERVEGRSGGKIQLKYFVPTEYSTVNDTMNALPYIRAYNLAKVSKILQITQ